MRTLLKSVYALAATLAVVATPCISSYAQEFPTKPIHLITNGGADTPNDLFLRVLGEEMRKSLGQPVLVENKVGGGGALAYEYVAKEAAADGYTYLLGNLPLMAIFPLATKDLRFDPVKDFTPVTGIGELNLAWGSKPDSPWKNFPEMIAYIKARPNQLFYGDTSVFTRLWTEGLLGHYGISVTRVPYSNASDAFRDVLAGGLDVQYMPLGSLLSMSNGDKKPLIMAVTSRQRDPLAPDVPTMIELGAPQLAIGGNYTIVARAGTPNPIVEKVGGVIARAVDQADVQATLGKLGITRLARTPDEVKKDFAGLVDTFTGIAKRIDLKPE